MLATSPIRPTFSTAGGGRGVRGGLDAAVKFSQASYAKEQHRPADIYGFKYDPMLSNKRNAVYYSPDEKQLVVAFRGTDFSDKKDVWEDVRIATGTFEGAQRVKNGKDIVKQAAQKYSIPVPEVQLTGHSLGGRIAQAVGTKLRSERITAINPGSSPLDLISRTAGAGAGRTYTTGIDPISISNTLVHPGSVRFITPGGLEPHGLGNFSS